MSVDTYIKKISKKIVLKQGLIYLRKSTIVPRIPLIGKDIRDIAQLTLFNILLDGGEEFVFCDLESTPQFVRYIQYTHRYLLM